MAAWVGIGGGLADAGHTECRHQSDEVCELRPPYLGGHVLVKTLPSSLTLIILILVRHNNGNNN